MSSPDRGKIYRFRIDQLLGKGGSGTVYRAIDTANGQVVAVKLFHANFFRNRMHERDFARSVVQFKKFVHPNVVRILEHISGDEGECLVEEYVDGPDLKWYIENRPWNLQERLVVAAQICNGLQYIHEQGFTHHDMKPANILFTRKGVVKITDYSLARQNILSFLSGGISEQVTPMYISPELIQKEKATPRSDIYSLGITFYLFFTGRLPFEVDSLQKLYICHLKVVPIHPTVANPQCPQILGDIIMRMIEKKPENRFPDADMLRITLSEVGRSRI
ncbi:MAG: serine/threonine-protein kinase [FCB group bacterium]|jgi:serine/threonine-protein kinase|nr:serine/threonine-protein kinase [FCB group bacterium]